MRVACYQSGVDGIGAGPGWAAALSECSRLRVDLLVTPEFAVGGLAHTALAARDRAVADVNSLRLYVAHAPADMTVVLGFTESAKSGMHSSAAVFRGGRIITVGRKVHPREPGLAAGDGSHVFDVAGTPCGVLVCADATYAEPAASLANDGARVLVCILNNDMSNENAARWQSRTDHALRARAHDNQCWVVSADVAGTSPGRRALAATCVYRPDGRLIRRSNPEPDAFIVHDID